MRARLAARRPFLPNLKLQAIVERFRVNEVIVAAREQRGGAMPLDDLLECRVAGVPVCDLSAFYERMRGEVPVDSLKASWLIYGAGFDQNPLRRLIKRTTDVLPRRSCLSWRCRFWCWRPRDLPRERVADLLPQERVGRGGRTIQRAEAADDAASTRRATVSRAGRRRGLARDAGGPRAAQTARRRTAATGQRAQRRHEPGRAAAGASGASSTQLREEIRFYECATASSPGSPAGPRFGTPTGRRSTMHSASFSSTFSTLRTTPWFSMC